MRDQRRDNQYFTTENGRGTGKLFRGAQWDPPGLAVERDRRSPGVDGSSGNLGTGLHTVDSPVDASEFVSRISTFDRLLLLLAVPKMVLIQDKTSDFILTYVNVAVVSRRRLGRN